MHAFVERLNTVYQILLLIKRVVYRLKIAGKHLNT